MADTPFGRTRILVGSDISTIRPAQALETVKALKPVFQIVPLAITASENEKCGDDDRSTTASSVFRAAAYLKSPFVIGANAAGKNNYSKSQPSVYCGVSVYADPTGRAVGASQPDSELVFFEINKTFDAGVGHFLDQEKAKIRCPELCAKYDAVWSGQWTNTTAGSSWGVCGCQKSNSLKQWLSNVESSLNGT